jgi:hypothetical protein
MASPPREPAEQLNAEDVERVYRCTDSLRLSRDRVHVPRRCAERGREIVFADGRILLRAPRRVDFEVWLRGLPDRLARLGRSGMATTRRVVARTKE